VPETTVREALASGDMGFLHSFTTGSAVDGPGIRVVVWTTGCNWRCMYCHNPDTWTMRNGIPVAVSRASEQLSRYRHGLATMKGGLTISGGEPLVQDRFVVKLLAAAKGMGIHTAIETNGWLGERLSDDELASIDLVLLGMKAFDPSLHQRVTGRDPAPTHAFARRLAELRKPVWGRYVLVPGLTDAPDEIERIADYAASLGNVERMDVLPFHQLGAFKWHELGMKYALEGVAPADGPAVTRACEVFRARGLVAY
jgi:pyruvate formate lyase activating enzyme